MSRLLALCGAALVATGCGSDPALLGSEPRDTGVAEFALTATIGSTNYTVVGATLEIIGPASGPATKTIVDISAPVVQVVLKPGACTVALTGTPQLALTTAPNVPIDAELVSPNPQSFNIGESKETPVSFKFKPKTGKVAVGVTYSLAGGYLRGTATVTSVAREHPAPVISNVFDSLLNQTISFSGTWEQAVATVQDGLVGGSKERVFAIGDVTPQFGGEGAILSGIFAARDHRNSALLFNALNGVVTMTMAVPLGMLYGGTGPSGTHVAGDVEYACMLVPRPGDLDLAAYGATIDAAGYPDGNALLNVPIELRCYRMLYYDMIGQLFYGDSAQLRAEGFADLVPSMI